MLAVKVGYNKKAYEPMVKAIQEKYYEMFRGKGGAGDEDESAPAAAAGGSSSAHGAA